MRNFCKIDRGGWLYSEFEVALWCYIPNSGLNVNLLSHEEFLQKLIGVGKWLDLGWLCGVTYQIQVVKGVFAIFDVEHMLNGAISNLTP